MTSEDFVRAIKIQTSDAAVYGTVAMLKRPAGRKPREKDVRLSEWYGRISDADQRMLELALKEAAELAVFEFLCVLDGVTVVEDAPTKGDLELHFVKDSQRLRINASDGEELHNIFNRLCAEPAFPSVRNPAMTAGDVGDAVQIKGKLRVGDEMDLHHLPDKYASIATISGYDQKTAPAVALLKPEHRKMSS